MSAGDMLDQDKRPAVRIESDNLPELLRVCNDALAPELFVQGGQLVKIGAPAELQEEEGVAAEDVSDEAETPAQRKRQADQPVVTRNITAPWVEVRMSELVRFYQPRGSKGIITSVNCPSELASKFVNMPEWPRLRPLDAIVSAPFIREDGTICDTEGYDRKARAYLKLNADFPEIPEHPTKQNAEASRDTLLNPFSEFPFDTAAAKSAFLAHILTEAARLSVDTAPMFWYTAPDAGTGKSLLSDMPTLIVHGRLPPRRSWPSDEEELRKQLFASLLAGDRAVILDNLSTGRKVRTEKLCAVLTSPVWTDRVLGVSKSVEVRNYLTVAASGNNVTPAGDMARRSIVVRLDANSPDLKGRRFKIRNLRGYVREHRVELLTAALTILRAHHVSGWKSDAAPLPSFEQWSERVRDAIVWLGMADPVDTQAAETDDDTRNLKAAFDALGPTYSVEPFQASDVARLVGGNDSLNRVLMDAGCDEPFNIKKVGMWLRACRGKIRGDWKLQLLSSPHGTNRWIFERVAANADLA